MFEIPVVLIIFRRSDTIPRIIERLREIKPIKIYLLGDQGRNLKEIEEVEQCRKLVESLIDWDCEVVKNYADTNRGVYKNIGEGACWVFKKEKKAIFLEDDNLPEVSFFKYTKELLDRYEEEPKVAWICGTNYLPEMASEYSYQFTKHLLPCGWASWSEKFLKLYDGHLEKFKYSEYRKNFRDSYSNKLLYFYQKQLIKNEEYRFKKNNKFLSWDYQMLWSVRSQGLFGIVPMCNQITNIGVDDFSIHGGNNKLNVMTSRFCEVKSKLMKFPLVHPPKIEVDKKCEEILGRIIMPPKKVVCKNIISSKLKHLIGKDSSISWENIIKGKEK